MLKYFKRPYAALVVIMATAVAAAAMSIHPEPAMQKVAFTLATVLVGGFGAKASLAVAGGAFKVAVLMVGCILTLFTCAVLFVDHVVFAAFVLESTAQVVGGAVVVVVGDLLARQIGNGPQPE